jgi:hypothetical protein
VEAFVLQLGRWEQHTTILALLSELRRDLRNGRLAYKAPGAAPLTSVLEVARWVDARVGLAHGALLDRARRVDSGRVRPARPCLDAPLVDAPLDPPLVNAPLS